jgi:hypothetical protein
MEIDGSLASHSGQVKKEESSCIFMYMLAAFANHIMTVSQAHEPVESKQGVV